MDMGLAFEEEQKKAFRKSSSVKEKKDEPLPVWGKNDPQQYFSIHGVLKQMPKADPLPTAFANGPSAHNRPLLTRDRVEVLPGIFSFDKEMLDYQRWLSNELNSRFPVDLDEDLFTRTGIHATFDSLRCPAGYFQTPMSYTTVDNSAYREELGLNLNYSPRQKAIALEFWKLIFSTAKASPINVSKISTSGMRRFTGDAQWKLDYANFITQPIEFERMLNAVHKKDWRLLANRYETLYATYIQKRGQVDKPGKIRKVFGLDYALSGGRQGETFPTDKRVILHGQEWTDFSAIRARVVHAGPWTINCFLQMIATSAMQAMFENFGKTFHVNTPEQIKAVVDGKYIFCSDVTEYDRSMSKDAIWTAHEAMYDFWDERMVESSWRLFVSPYYAKPLDLDGNRGQWVLDPTDWSQELFAGNRSGHALTSLIAKGNKVIESLFVIDKIYPVLGRVSSFLKHNMPMTLVNNGDDEIVCAEQLSDMKRFKEYRKDKSVGHYVVNPEDGNGYSGMLLVKPTEALEYFPQARVHTSLEKMWIPERSIGGLHRQYWPIGMMDRISNLTKTDTGREVWSVALHGYRKFLQPKHGDINEILTNAVSKMDVNIDGLSDKERDLLASQDKIHYYYLPSEISDEILNKITTKIPLERTMTVLKSCYRGTIQ